MVYIPFWICAFAGAVIDVRERRFPNALAAACAVAAFAGVWLDRGLNTALDHAGPAVIVYLSLVLTESLWRRFRQAPGIGMGDAKALFALCTLDPLGGIVAFAVALLVLALSCLFTKSRILFKEHAMATNQETAVIKARMDRIPAALSPELVERIAADRASGVVNPYRCCDDQVIRRIDRAADKGTLMRPAFMRDTEKILHLPAYTRYAGKTQVFSFRSNDDLSRRGLHVQLVSRIARDIGRALGLNSDLIEAIGLGHDLGHTPFGHAGERFLSEIYHERTGRYFFHNVQSVRVLDALYGRNVSLQTLDGVLCHNGEYEQRVFELSDMASFDQFDRTVEDCIATGYGAIEHLRPMTLEGCVVRISDILAYVGRDRQDAIAAGLLSPDAFDDGRGGAYNSWILTHASIDIVEHSYGKPRIEMSEDLFEEIRRAKRENYEKIYSKGGIEGDSEAELREAFEKLYDRCLQDLNKGDEFSYIFKHHVSRIEQQLSYYDRTYAWQDDKDQAVVDYIASMTDGYFCELTSKLFPGLKFPHRTYINER